MPPEPGSIEQLRDLLAAANLTIESAAPDCPPANNQSPRSYLIVTDDFAKARLVETLLEEYGFSYHDYTRDETSFVLMYQRPDGGQFAVKYTGSEPVRWQIQGRTRPDFPWKPYDRTLLAFEPGNPDPGDDDYLWRLGQRAYPDEGCLRARPMLRYLSQRSANRPPSKPGAGGNCYRRHREGLPFRTYLTLTKAANLAFLATFHEPQTGIAAIRANVSQVER